MSSPISRRFSAVCGLVSGFYFQLPFAPSTPRIARSIHLHAGRTNGSHDSGHYEASRLSGQMANPGKPGVSPGKAGHARRGGPASAAVAAIFVLLSLVVCVLGVSTTMLWRQTQTLLGQILSLDARLVQLEGSCGSVGTDIGVVNTTLWHHVQDHDARLVQADVDLQGLRAHVNRSDGQGEARFGGGGGSGGGFGSAEQFDSAEEVARRLAAAEGNELPGVPITADALTKTLMVGGSLDVDGDVVFRGRVFVSKFTKIFDAPTPAPTLSPQPSSIPTMAVCPAVEVAASTTAAGASCAGGAASGSPTCAFTCASGYSHDGASSITCGTDGESRGGGDESCLARALITSQLRPTFSLTSLPRLPSLPGAWPTYPTCSEEVTCSTISVTASTTTAGASCAGGAASGSPTCDFTCAPGYSLVGAGTIACDANGE